MLSQKPLSRELHDIGLETTRRWLVRACLIGTLGFLVYLYFWGRGVTAQFLFYAVALLWTVGIVFTMAAAYVIQRRNALASVHAGKYRRSANFQIIGNAMILLAGVLAGALMQILDAPLEAPIVYIPSLIVAGVGIALVIYRLAVTLYIDVSIHKAQSPADKS